MKKKIRKLIAGILAAACVLSLSLPVMADNAKPKVIVNFICGGSSTGKTVDAGSNVTAPAVPLMSGYTFCGFDKSLYNITQDTVITAVYVSDSLGKDAINAKKASLPTPAISSTTVADPNAPMASVQAVPAQNIAQTAANTVANAASDPAAAQQAALAALQQAQMAASNVNVAAAAQTAAQAIGGNANAAQAAQTAVQAAQAAAQAANALQPAATQAAQTAVQAAATAQPVVAQAAQTVSTGLPSWAVSLHGVSSADCAKIYNYWKTVKNFDDSYIQAYWEPLLYHFSGHGMAGW